MIEGVLVDQAVLTQLAQAVGPGHVHTSGDLVQARRHDWWAVKALRVWRGEDVPAPAVVVQPADTAQVQAVLRIAHDHRLPVVPWGHGSGVVGGIEPGPDTLLLDLTRLAQVGVIDRTNLLATFGAGCNGLVAEQAVAAEGLTIGHWPQSIALSSVGGWVATRASGQYSTAYGNIEDMVHSLQAVLADGSLVQLGRAPRASAGPDLRHLLLGSEGTLAVITEVTLKLRRAPEQVAFSAFHVPDLAAGFEAQRELVQQDWLPPVMRQYDAAETRRKFQRFQGQASDGLLLLVHEGPASRVAAEQAAAAAVASAAGLQPADPAAGEHWLVERNQTGHWRDAFARQLVMDTIEVSAPWTRIGAVYQRACAALADLPGLRVASAHSSHVYRDGLNLYFTFAVHCPDPATMEGAYFAAWQRVMDATLAEGGGMAHHHGVGRVRKPWLGEELGAGGLAMLRQVKQALDPHGILNPGALLPEAAGDG